MLYEMITGVPPFDADDVGSLLRMHVSEEVPRFETVAPDCMGPWLVYWRMNMPGLFNSAIDLNGMPMKNWWVFLFY